MSLVRQNRFRHVLLTALWLLAMSALLGFLGWFLFGGTGLLMALAMAGLLLFLSPRFPVSMAMRVAGARPLHPSEAPFLFDTVHELARSAGLSRTPALFYLPRAELNAFATGREADAGLAVTDGLLRYLDRRELRAVLAHEMSHLANRDLALMNLAAILQRVTSSMALFGQVLLLISLPLMLFGNFSFPWTLILVLWAAPLLSDLMALALSRTREFDADLGAVTLTGDARGLASALRKLEHRRRGIWSLLFQPYRRGGSSSWLNTHPHTDERVRRLLAYEASTLRDRDEESVRRPSPRRKPLRPEDVFLRRGSATDRLGFSRF
ncbi:M48 family metalloprotease [Sulfidibacter corallicola]|uniref:M48 family metalloprotease n=1 Tax=Sulfidibacter corallicola TaxID=2818388 RepID=A0A8A4TR15_SULCO|nr:zinc metalloprotease HtpX [Sulfidibacter corallicola]QTD51963.1 M48 family metalloprotease [Sulfidibacter corallicola]